MGFKLSLTIILMLGAVLGSTSLIAGLANSGYMNSALTRSVAGGVISFTSANFLVGYTNLESFISASANGTLGFSGFVFIGGLIALLITWLSNLFEFGVLVK